jgi:hypothetical protein
VSVLVVVVLVLAVAVPAVHIVDVLIVSHGRVAATGTVNMHMPNVGLVDVVGAIGAVLDRPAGTMEMSILEEVPVVLVADQGVAAALIVDVGALRGTARFFCHDLIICLPA